MPEYERRTRIPGWAEQDRLRDLAWLAENLPVLWPVAQAGYAELGRGAVGVDTTVRVRGGGHPFGYLSQAQIVAFGDLDAIRMVATYAPERQLLVILVKPHERVSTYRLGLPRPSLHPPHRA